MSESLFQKYRPRQWSDVIGQQKLVASIARLRQRGSLGGKAFWLSGPSGTGKTTCAYLIAADVCDPDNFIELDAGDITPAKLADLELSLRNTVIGTKPGRAVLINEAHGLRKDAIRKLLVILERIPRHVTWVFSTITAGQQQILDGMDGSPLLSRCLAYELDGVGHIQEFAQRAWQIAEIEGLGGAEPAEFITLAKECKANFRAMLSRIETGDMIRETTEIASPEGWVGKFSQASPAAQQVDVAALLASLGV